MQLDARLSSFYSVFTSDVVLVHVVTAVVGRSTEAHEFTKGGERTDHWSFQTLHGETAFH